MQLRKDARLTLTPAGAITETFYLLSGRLGGDVSGSACVLRPGDTVFGDTVFTELAEPPTLTALSDVRLLYLTEKPQFHPFNERLGQKRFAAKVKLKNGYTASPCERLQELFYRTRPRCGSSEEGLDVQIPAHLRQAASASPGQIVTRVYPSALLPSTEPGGTEGRVAEVDPLVGETEVALEPFSGKQVRALLPKSLEPPEEGDLLRPGAERLTLFNAEHGGAPPLGRNNLTVV